MNIADKIKLHIKNREDFTKTMEELALKDSLDEAEQKTFDDADSQIRSIDHSLDNLKKAEQSQAAQKAMPVDKGFTPEPAAKVTPQVELEQDKSLFIARQVHALYMAGGNRMAASMYAKESLRDPLLGKVLAMPADVIQRAAVGAGDSGTSGWAAELVTINQANQAFIEMLRPMSILARFPGRQMGFDGAGSIKIPRQSLGSTGGWVGEGGAIKVDRMTLDSIELTPKKNANIIAASNELLARSTPSAMSLIRDDILRGIAISIDTKFVSADAAVAGVSPAGIQTFDGTPTASTGATLDNITTDLKAAINAMLAVNMPMAQPVWMLNPQNINALQFIRDGVGNLVFKDEIAMGTLVGYPFITSTTIPADVVMLVDASQVIVATELAPEVAISGDASIHMEDTPNADIGGAATPVQSMFQTDSTAVRATTRLDFNARYDECVQVITGVTWAS